MNHKHKITDFSTQTSISTVRNHLIKNHLADWVGGCDELEIKICGSKGKEAERKFRNLPEPTNLESDRPKFSKDAFVDALTEFVIGDDQVCVEFNLKVVKLTFDISQ